MKAILGDILHFHRKPSGESDTNAWEYHDNGVLIIDDAGKVDYAGSRDAINIPADAQVEDWSGHLVMPGFIDTHAHYAQTDMIASYGEQLLDWLNTYTFPTERSFADEEHAHQVADVFLNELLRNGTTTACVFPTVHPTSVDAFFSASTERGMRMIAGKVLMDRNCPEWLSDDVESAERDTRALIERWHGKGRSLYAITPRFAPTSTPEQLAMAGRLYKEYDGVYVQSHVAENRDEVKWVASLFPEARSYLDVYQRFGLLGERAIYAHCIHLDDDDRKLMADTGTAIAFSPTSNLFLGSGLFDLDAAYKQGAKVGVATDVGAGTSFSILATLNEAYKIQQLNGHRLNPFNGLYLATLGGAEALGLEGKIGNFDKGKEADFVVLDFDSTPLLKRRVENTHSLSEKLFALMMLGDDRAVVATYIAGKLLHKRDGKQERRGVTPA